MTSLHTDTLLAAGFQRLSGNPRFFTRAATESTPRLLAQTMPEHPRGLSLWQPGLTHLNAPIVTTPALRQLLERLGVPVPPKQQ